MASKDQFTLTVTNEKGVLYYGDCTILFLPTTRGEIAVMRHHTPMIAMLAPGTVRMDTGQGKRDVVELQTGVVYVAEDEVSILVDL